MQVNTVCISLDEHNSLKQFKKEVESGKIFCIKISHTWDTSRNRSKYVEDIEEKYYTENEVIENFSKKNADLEDKIGKLKSESSDANHRVLELNSELNKVRAMSCREFRKWRKQRNN